MPFLNYTRLYTLPTIPSSPNPSSVLLTNNLSLPHQPRRNPLPSGLPINRQLIQKSPLTRRLPPLRLPIIQSPLGEPIHNRDQTPIVRHAHKHILIGIEIFQRVHAFLGCGWVDIPCALLLGDFVEGFGAVILGVAVGMLKDAAGARSFESRIHGHGAGNGSRHGCVSGRSIRAAEMAYITAHENECIGCRTGEAGDMAYSVSRYVEEEETTVAEEVEGGEGADFVGGGEGDFVHGAASEVAFEHGGIFSCRIPGHESFFEAGADVEVC